MLCIIITVLTKFTKISIMHKCIIYKAWMELCSYKVLDSSIVILPSFSLFNRLYLFDNHNKK